MHADFTNLEIVTLIRGAGAMNFKLAKDGVYELYGAGMDDGVEEGVGS